MDAKIEVRKEDQPDFIETAVVEDEGLIVFQLHMPDKRKMVFFVGRAQLPKLISRLQELDAFFKQ